MLNREMKACHLKDNANQLVVFEDRNIESIKFEKQNILITTFLNKWFEKSDRITGKNPSYENLYSFIFFYLHLLMKNVFGFWKYDYYLLVFH